MYLLTEGMLCRAALLVTLLYMGTSGLPTASTFLTSLEELGDTTSSPWSWGCAGCSLCAWCTRGSRSPHTQQCWVPPCPCPGLLRVQLPPCWASVLCFAHQKFPSTGLLGAGVRVLFQLSPGFISKCCHQQNLCKRMMGCVPAPPRNRALTALMKH